MLRFVRRDMRNRRENIRAVGRGPFDAIPVVDPAFTRFMVHIKVLEIVIEVDTASAEVSAQKCRMSRENGRDVDVSLAAERDRKTRLPLVEMCDNGF